MKNDPKAEAPPYLALAELALPASSRLGYIKYAKRHWMRMLLL
jgi:hypothetical protein